MYDTRHFKEHGDGIRVSIWNNDFQTDQYIIEYSTIKLETAACTEQNTIFLRHIFGFAPAWFDVTDGITTNAIPKITKQIRKYKSTEILFRLIVKAMDVYVLKSFWM